MLKRRSPARRTGCSIWTSQSNQMWKQIKRWSKNKKHLNETMSGQYAQPAGDNTHEKTNALHQGPPMSSWRYFSFHFPSCITGMDCRANWWQQTKLLLQVLNAPLQLCRAPQSTWWKTSPCLPLLLGQLPLLQIHPEYSFTLSKTNWRSIKSSWKNCASRYI